MNWTEKQIVLRRLGYFNFESEDEFTNWLEWENDDKQLEKRIKTALNGSNYNKPEKTTNTGSRNIHTRELCQ